MSVAASSGPRWLGALIVAAAVAFVVASLGGWATDLSPWYRALAKPVWQPPGWVFPPAWTLIFALIAMAGAASWRGAHGAAGRRKIIAAYAFNAVWNVLWSVLFFQAQRPDWALAEVVLLWASVVMLIVVSRPYARASTWLLAPYLVWVSFASVLNLAIVWLNVPF